MPEPRTTPQEHDKPVFQPTTPGSPTPEDPRENEPIQDPPVDPEHDGVPRRAGGDNDVERGVGTPRSTDNVVFDENHKPG
jgi:hypothetical protein